MLSYEEQRRYFAHATPVLFDLATLILETGARPEEIYTIEARNVSLEARSLTIPKGRLRPLVAASSSPVPLLRSWRGESIRGRQATSSPARPTSLAPSRRSTMLMTGL